MIHSTDHNQLCSDSRAIPTEHNETTAYQPMVYCVIQMTSWRLSYCQYGRSNKLGKTALAEVTPAISTVLYWPLFPGVWIRQILNLRYFLEYKKYWRRIPKKRFGYLVDGSTFQCVSFDKKMIK